VLYPNLDWLIPWYVDDYVNLDRNQSSQVSSRLAQQLDWHCRTQLPQYAGFFREIRRDVENDSQGLTLELLKVYNDRLTGYWYTLLEQITPDIIDILLSATDEQIAELFENLEKKNKEMESTFVEPPPQEVIRNRQKKMLKRLRYWFSNLTESQKQAVAEWSMQLEPIADEWIAHRRKVQHAAKRLTAHRDKAVKFETEFFDLLINSRKLRTENYRKKIDINTESTLALLAQLSKTLSPTQKTHFSNRLQSLVTDLDRLSCDPASKANRASINSSG
jgi:hypothetical protein